MSAVFSSYGKPGSYHDLAVFFYYTDALNTKDGWKTKGLIPSETKSRIRQIKLPQNFGAKRHHKVARAP